MPVNTGVVTGGRNDRSLTLISVPNAVFVISIALRDALNKIATDILGLICTTVRGAAFAL